MFAGLRPSRMTAGGRPSDGAGLDLAVEDTDVAEDVREPAPREPVHGCRNTAAAPELGGDHELPLALGLDREQPGAVHVDVEVVPVRVPGLHALEHRPALDGVVDDVHVRARDEPGAPPAGVHVDDDVGHREEHARQEVGELLVRRPVGAPGERAVEVRARRPAPRVRLRRLDREHRDHDDPPRDPLRLEPLEQAHRGDLALVLVAVVAGEHEDRRPVAVRDLPDVDERARPAGGVVDLREGEVADLLARRGEVDRAADRRVGHARESRKRVTAASVPSSSRSTSSSVCAYEKCERLRLSGSSKMPSFISSRR